MAMHRSFLAFIGFCVLLAWPVVAAALEPAGVVGPEVDCGTTNWLHARMPIWSGDVIGDVARLTDEQVPEEGTPWDATSTVILESRETSLVYDLVTPRLVGALYLQADANDSYVVWGTANSSPSDFQILAQLPTADAQGYGLRNRVVEFPQKSVRYLRLSTTGWDGRVSVSEFSAYCRAPDPFPPHWSKATPMQRAPSQAGPPVINQSTPEVHPSPWLKLAGALALLGLAMRLWRRRSRSCPPQSLADASSQCRAAQAHRVLCLLFFASGCSALIYEIVWMHLLRLVIGASAISVAVVLASFMGGMLLGSLLFPRLVGPNRDPIVVYAWLEIGIGAFGLLLPIILPAAKYVYLEWLGHGPLGLVLRGVVASLLLLPPTALMGATLPTIARRYPTNRRGMAAIAALYATNSIGAVAGCLLAAFYLLAIWDVWIASLFASALNIGIGALIYLFGPSRFFASPRLASGAICTSSPRNPHSRLSIYANAAAAGLTALGCQVIWTRLLALLFGASVYAFAIILAVFLGGLGLGSLWASRQLRRGTDAVRGLMFCQLASIPTMLLGGVLLAAVLPYGLPPNWIPTSTLHLLHLVRATAVVLPAAACWGGSFPFALAAASRGSADAGRATGLVYASNTIGAIVGALGTSLWLIPRYGTHHSGQVLILVSALAASVLLPAASRTSTRRSATGNGGPKRYSAYVWVLALGAFGVGALPMYPRKFLANGRYLVWSDDRDKYPYVTEGVASTVAVQVAPNGYKFFHVSGRVEASSTPDDLRTQRLIGHLSAFAHPHPESALVVGLGSGITAGALTLHPEIKRIVVCEIEPRVLDAASHFAWENYAVLKNPRVQVVLDDARHYLATTREKFDIITSDPIHPWVRGNSILFSEEYYATVKERLKSGGVASQWVPLYETSELAIQIQAKTFMNAFADGTVWNTAANHRGYDVVFIGSNGPLNLVVQELQARIDRNPELEASLREVRLGSATALLSTYGTSGRDMTAWLNGIPVNRDFSLRLEYISGLAMNARHAEQIYAHMTANRSFPAQLFVAKPDVLDWLERRFRGDSGG